jgi:hypothetical protein
MSADPQIVDLDEQRSEVEQLAADGVEIELAGALFRLKFSFASLRHLERAFGSLDAFADAVRAGSDGELLGMLEAGITAGLLQERLPTEVRQQMLEDALGPPVDWGRIHGYRDAVIEACVQAGLLTRLKRTDPPAEGEDTVAGPSPGASATTTRRSRSAARTPSSGT